MAQLADATNATLAALVTHLLDLDSLDVGYRGIVSDLQCST